MRGARSCIFPVRNISVATGFCMPNSALKLWRQQQVLASVHANSQAMVTAYLNRPHMQGLHMQEAKLAHLRLLYIAQLLYATVMEHCRVTEQVHGAMHDATATTALLGHAVCSMHRMQRSPAFYSTECCILAPVLCCAVRLKRHSSKYSHALQCRCRHGTKAWRSGV